MSEQRPESAVVLTGAACSAKAALGPTAWAVLEELTLGAERGRDGRLVVTTSVRRLAVVLGLDKDTVARALGRLSAGGFVVRRAPERPADGSCYVMATVAGLTRLDAGDDPDAVVRDTDARPSNGDSSRRPELGDGSRPRRPRRARGPAGGGPPRADQLSLLGDDLAPDDATTTTPSPTPSPTTSTRPSTPVDQHPRRSS